MNVLLPSIKAFLQAEPGLKIRQIFFGPERNGGAVPSKKLERSGGAKISENFDSFGVFHEFFANYCSRGTKTLTHYS
jgi:hypothetical protein